MSTPAAAIPPLTTLRTGLVLHRVHGDGRAARWYGRRDATSRWDDPDGVFGVMYLGRALEGAFSEALLRSPSDRDVLWSRVQQKRRARFKTTAPLRLAKLHGVGLAWWGVTAAQIAESDYDAPQTLARKIGATTVCDGIHYRSRFDNDELCIALFDRADGKLDLVSQGDPIDKTWVQPTLKRRGYTLLEL